MTTATPEAGPLFAAHGLRCTRQRRAIYDALAASREHPTAEELHRAVCRTDEDGISLATVYNTLEAFCQAGLAHKLPGGPGGARYDAARGGHLHARCQATGAVADVSETLSAKVLAQLPPELLAEIEAELGFKVTGVHVELVGRFSADRSPAATS